MGSFLITSKKLGKKKQKQIVTMIEIEQRSLDIITSDIDMDCEDPEVEIFISKYL